MPLADHPPSRLGAEGGTTGAQAAAMNKTLCEPPGLQFGPLGSPVALHGAAAVLAFV
jgi:hypothetical protein